MRPMTLTGVSFWWLPIPRGHSAKDHIGRIRNCLRQLSAIGRKLSV